MNAMIIRLNFQQLLRSPFSPACGCSSWQVLLVAKMLAWREEQSHLAS